MHPRLAAERLVPSRHRRTDGRRDRRCDNHGEETARAYLHLGELLRVRGDHAGALAAMDDGEREAARLGLRGSFGHFMFVNAADDLLRLGRWDDVGAACA